MTPWQFRILSIAVCFADEQSVWGSGHYFCCGVTEFSGFIQLCGFKVFETSSFVGDADAQVLYFIGDLDATYVVLICVGVVDQGKAFLLVYFQATGRCSL